jgi:hypothetical protein
MMGLFFAYIRTVFSWFWQQITIYLPVFSRKRETSLDSAAIVSNSAETSVEVGCNISDEKESPTLQEEVVEMRGRLRNVAEGVAEMTERLSNLEEGVAIDEAERGDLRKGISEMKERLSNLEEGVAIAREEVDIQARDMQKQISTMVSCLRKNGKLEGFSFSNEGESHVGELDVIEAGAPVPPPDHVKGSTTTTTTKVYGAEKAETILGKNVSEGYFASKEEGQEKGRSVN